jgi:hypothetical protein
MRGFDHYILPTLDLDGVCGRLEQLGFRFSPVAEHEGLGTRNRVAQFDNSYLEVLAGFEEHSGPMKQFWEPIARARPGLSLLSLDSDDLDKDREGLEKRGIAFSPVLHVVRDVPLPDGSIAQLDSVNSIARYEQAPLLSIFLTQHRRPEVTYSEGGRPHPNGAVVTCGFTYVAADLPQAVVYLAEFLGSPTSQSPDHAAFTTRTGPLTVFSPDGLEAAYPPGFARRHTGLGSHPVSVRYGTGNLAATRAYLEERGVRLHPLGQGFGVAETDAAGLAIEFVSL